MGLLDKTNPRANRRSLIVWTILGGLGGLLFALAAAFCCDMPWFFTVPFMTIAGAVASGACHWQVAEELDEDSP